MKINKILLFGMMMVSSIFINNKSLASNSDYQDNPKVIGFGGSNSDYFRSIINTSDGGFAVAGYYTLSKDLEIPVLGTYDALVAKYDKNGNQEWYNIFGGSEVDDFFSIVEAPDGGFICIGESRSTNAGFSNRGSEDGVFVKYDINGNREWIKSFGGSGRDFLYSAIRTSDNGILCVGESSSKDFGFTHQGGGWDAFIVKFNSDYTRQWIKNFGGSYNEEFYSAIETSDGGFIAVGSSISSNAGFTHKGGGDAIIVKYSSNGDQEWFKSFGGSDTDSFRSVIQTPDSGFVVTGYSTSTDAGFISKGNNDAIMVKYNSNGEEQWVRTFGGSNNESFSKIMKTLDGNFIVTGSSSSTDAGFSNKGGSDVVMIKYNSDMEQQWINTFGSSGNDVFNLIIETSDGDLRCAGYTTSNDLGFENKGKEDAMVVIFTIKDECLSSIKVAEANPTYENISKARMLINAMPEGPEKDAYQLRLNAIIPEITFDKKIIVQT